MKETATNGALIFIPNAVEALGILAVEEQRRITGVGELPTPEEMEMFCGLPVVKEIYMESGWDTDLRRRRLVELAQKYLAHNNVGMALRAVVLAGRF